MASKNLIEVFDHSDVKFTEECTFLVLSLNSINFSSLYHHRINISSMYLRHKYGSNSDTLIISSSSSPINKMLYGSANLVQISVSCFCISIFFSNVKTASANPVMVSVETYFSFRYSSSFLNASRFSLYSMFGCNPTNSIVHKTMSSGNVGREPFLRNR